jgi:sugar/nucleoside kinase (ribokinase family)
MVPRKPKSPTASATRKRPAATRPTPERTRKPSVPPVPGGLAVGVGHATVDMLCVAPRIGERIVDLSVFSMQGGGSMGNLVATMAALGGRTRYFGRLSDDDFGRYIVAGLEEFEVDCKQVMIQSGMVSPVSIVQIDELSRRRKILSTRGSTTPLSPRDLPRDLLDGAQLLCIDGYLPAVQVAIAEKARERGIKVLLNASHLHSEMDELLRLSDYVIGSERFAADIAPSDKIERSLAQIARLGPSCVVITQGDAGAIGLEGDALVKKEAIDVFIADTTGAGDVFCGAFAYGVLQGWGIDRNLPFANATAGLCCRTVGARAGLPSMSEILEFL